MEEKPAFPSQLFLKISCTVIWGLRCSMEYPLRGILFLLNYGRKKQVPPAENGILLLTAGQLAERIRKRELTSEEVVRAYVRRIGEVNALVHAVVEGRFEAALQEARAADQLVISGAMSTVDIAERLPLLGVPFTAKEAIFVKGLPCTCGLVRRKGFRADEDSAAVSRMRTAGAIPLALTNTSELCMWWESYNHLHGRTCNPYDTSRTAGGSSGGEAALLASAGSVIGLGTDLGGSIRLPAFFNGVFGHKPTQDLIPTEGLYPPLGNEVAPYATLGPMSRYATDLKLVLSVLVGREQTRRLKLFEPVDLRSVKVYYMLSDSGERLTSPVSSDVKEAIKKVIGILSLEGISTEEISLRQLETGVFTWCGNLACIKDQNIAKLLTGDVPTGKGVEPCGPSLLRDWLAGNSDHTFPVIINSCFQDVSTYFTKPLNYYIHTGRELKAELLSLLEAGPAVFLYPTYPNSADHHWQIIGNLMNINYSVVFNALGFPITQCPLGLDSRGMPVGVQIVTAPGRDRLSIRLAEHIEEKLGGWTPLGTPEKTFLELMKEAL